jgi:hypothetical protein
MPIIWFEQHVVATKNVANLVKVILAAPIAGKILGIIFAIIGITLSLAACKVKRDHYKIPQTDNLKTDSQTATKNIPEMSPLMRN